jgi:hypothetical protein
MEQSAVEWLINELQNSPAFHSQFFKEEFDKAKELDKQEQQRSYSEVELYKMINDFCFDWNYNYKGELSQKQYLIEWFEQNKNKKYEK